MYPFSKGSPVQTFAGEYHPVNLFLKKVYDFWLKSDPSSKIALSSSLSASYPLPAEWGVELHKFTESDQALAENLLPSLFPQWRKASFGFTGIVGKPGEFSLVLEATPK